MEPKAGFEPKKSISAHQHTLCSLLVKGQTPKQQAVQRTAIETIKLINQICDLFRSSTLARYKKYTFCAGFETLSLSQPVYSLFAADEGTNPETAVFTTIESICEDDVLDALCVI